MILFFGLAIGLITLMSTTCKKSDPDEPDPNTCSGYITASATGNLTANFCFDKLAEYIYVPGETVSFITNQEGEPFYSCHIQLNSYNGAFNGAGTYNCGFEEVGYVELVVHGTDNEFYKAQSGTITITQVDDTHFKATFNVVLVGYYNEKTVNFSGTINK